MAKQGFAASDRRKVELLSATTEIKAHDCGTVFILTADAAMAHTLPSIAKAGEGWWCRIVEGVNRSAAKAVTVTAAAGDTGIAAQTVLANDGTSHAITASGTPWVVTFVANVSDAGDQVELLVANGKWVTRSVAAT